MNLYRIHHTGVYGDSSWVDVTERNEKAAAKYFRAEYKGWQLDSIELFREDVTATKQQERDALKTIKKIVEELGPDSYLRTAFRGTFTDAESNIENDFGDNMYDRWQYAEEKLAKTEGALVEVADKLTAAIERIKSLEDEAEQQRIASEELISRMPTADDLTDFYNLTMQAIAEHTERMEAAAAKIVEAAGEPDSEEFREAYIDHRLAKRSLDYYKGLQERLVSTMRAGA